MVEWPEGSHTEHKAQFYANGKEGGERKSWSHDVALRIPVRGQCDGFVFANEHAVREGEAMLVLYQLT